MLRPLLAVLVSSGLMAAASAETIRFNPGGNVEVFAERTKANKGLVRIVGECESACTMYLGASRVCVARQARLMFHMAYFPDSGRPSIDGTRMMAAFWPDRVKALVMSRGGPPAPPGELWLTGDELVQCGIPRCARGPR